MVEDQLIARGIQDDRVLQAMNRVPREAFLPAEKQSAAYFDSALPIDHGQTISQPYTVAFMCEALRTRPTDRILEIGTGSGYAAAVLSHLAQTVHTVERIPELAAQADQRLRHMGYHNVFVHVADGTLGLPQEAPFDGIVVSASAPQLPVALAQQLADGGRIVIPIGTAENGESMIRYTRQGDELTSEYLGAFTFVPLIGKDGWDISELNPRR